MTDLKARKGSARTFAQQNVMPLGLATYDEKRGVKTANMPSSFVDAADE
jgi:hypothetical protein